MKKILLGSMVMLSCLVFGQKVKMKGDFILVDDNKCMKFTSKNLASSNTFYNLEDKKLFYIDTLNDNSTDADFKLQFSGSDEVLRLVATSMNFRTGIVKDLISEGVLDEKTCSVNFDKIADYKARYHVEQKPVNTTVIVNQNQSAPAAPRRGINIGVGFGR